MKQKKNKQEEVQHICTNENSKLVPVTEDGYKMMRVCNSCEKVMEKNVKRVTTFAHFIRKWIHNQLGKKTKLGRYQATNETLFYEGAGRDVGLGKDILAIRKKNGQIIGNASRLDRCGSYRRGDEAPAQRVMFSQRIAMIPFNVFEEARMNIRTARVIEQGKEEDFLLPRLVWNDSEAMMRPVNVRSDTWVKDEPKSDKNQRILSKKRENNSEYVYTKRGKPIRNKDGSHRIRTTKGWRYKYIDLTELEKRHFVGAMLLEVRGNYFLFDIDRNEVKHYRFNPFLTKLKGKCRTIKEAYEALKPIEVKRAERRGLKVKRQGEWFFIPTKQIPQKKEIPQKLRKQLENSPELSHYDLDSGVIESDDGDLVKSGDLYYGDVKLKYRKQIRSRVRDYNLAVKRYTKLEEQKEKFEEAYQVYDDGGELQAGNNRANTVEFLTIYNKINYCKGLVEHTGREHEPLKLEGWHIAVPNTAQASFTVTGNID